VIRLLTAKVIVSPTLALAMTSRSEPGPLSAVLVTSAADAQREVSTEVVTRRKGSDDFMAGPALLAKATKVFHWPLRFTGSVPPAVRPETDVHYVPLPKVCSENLAS